MSEDEPLFTPLDFISTLARAANIPPKDVSIPKRIVLTYERGSYEYAKGLTGGKPLGWWVYADANPPFCTGVYASTEVGVGILWQGAPAAVMTLEEAIACGATHIFEIGLAGSLQPDLKPGDIIVVTEAIRDEGTSLQYLPSETNVRASSDLRKQLVRCLKQRKIDHRVGKVWTTDGVYRETRKKVERYRHAGILAVNMETSAIFALAKFRNVEAASAQVISDVLSESGWSLLFRSEKIMERTKLLLETALEALVATD
jgi:uridine phosphorylase